MSWHGANVIVAPSSTTISTSSSTHPPGSNLNNDDSADDVDEKEYHQQDHQHMVSGEGSSRRLENDQSNYHHDHVHHHISANYNEQDEDRKQQRNNNYTKHRRHRLQRHQNQELSARLGSGGSGAALLSSSSRMIVSKTTETVEAALNRLSKSYSVAMECVGALHRADRHEQQQKIQSKESTSAETTKPSSSSSSKQENKKEEDKVGGTVSTTIREGSGTSSSSSSNPTMVSTSESDSGNANVLDKKDNDVDKKLFSVARTARDAFENAILRDPLVANGHAVLWNRRRYIHERRQRRKQREEEVEEDEDEDDEGEEDDEDMGDDDNNNNNNNKKRRRRQRPSWRRKRLKRTTSSSSYSSFNHQYLRVGGGPVVELRSAGHKATVQQLAYLSLVNYADLLLAGYYYDHDNKNSNNNTNAVTTNRDAKGAQVGVGAVAEQDSASSSSSSSILDRGLVCPLQVVSRQRKSCWIIQQQHFKHDNHSNRRRRGRRCRIGINTTNDQKQDEEQEVKKTQRPASSTTGKSPNDDDVDIDDDNKKNSAKPNVEPMLVENDVGNDDEKDGTKKVAALASASTDPETKMTDEDKNVSSKKNDRSQSSSPPLHTSSLASASDANCDVIEDPEATVRLALAAYMDATNIDGTDPTVWIKLAATARRLGRLQGRRQRSQPQSTMIPAALLPYRRLERHALERACTALSRGNDDFDEPPNRVAVRALQEWHDEIDNLTEYHCTLHDDDDVEVVTSHVLRLPRYAWSTLGRILLRVCKEGGNQAIGSPHHLSRQGASGGGWRPYHYHHRSEMATGPFTYSSSPCLSVSLQLSPLLVLPTSVWSKICRYLEPSQLWRIEATCRALSASILSARAVMDGDDDNNDDRGRHPISQHQQPSSSNLQQQQQQEEQQDKSVSGGDSSLPASGATQNDEGTGTNAPAQDDNNDKNSTSGSTTTTLQQGNRVSKRLRSQLITSGKRAERSSRRKSVPYCFLAATLGCTVDDKQYQKTIKEVSVFNNSSSNTNPWDYFTSKFLFRDGGTSQDVVASAAAAPDGAFTTQVVGVSRQEKSTTSATLSSSNKSRDDARERVADSSLSRFVENWKAPNSAFPISVLCCYIRHVSLHVEDVFSSDPGGSLVLSACLLECFDLLARKTDLGNDLIPSWSCATNLKMPGDVPVSQMELFAMDLLRAELRFKRCEGDDLVDVDFDGDVNYISTLVPSLLYAVERLDHEIRDSAAEKAFLSLRSRCSWLVAGFYFWRGRLSHHVSESREAEKEGMHFIEQTIEILGMLEAKSVKCISTPHLASPGRSGPHWKELTRSSLTTFREEIQASSILLVAQERFFEASAKLDGKQNLPLSQEDADALFSIGEVLMDRYKEATPARHAELIDDFLAVNGEKLLRRPFDDDEVGSSSLCEWFDEILPSEFVDKQSILLRIQSPCLLTILTVCLQTKRSRQVEIVHLLAQLVASISSLTDRTRHRLEQQERNYDFQDSDFSNSDDDDDDAVSTDGNPKNCTSKAADLVKLQQYAGMVRLLLDKLHVFLERGMTESERSCFLQSDCCLSLIDSSLHFIAVSFHRSNPIEQMDGCRSGDLEAFVAFQGLFGTMIENAEAEELTKKLNNVYLYGLVRIIHHQREILSDVLGRKINRVERSGVQKMTKKRANLVAAVCCQAGLLLSDDAMSDANSEHSPMFPFIPEGGDIGDKLLMSPLPLLCDSLLCLWMSSLPDSSENRPDGGFWRNQSRLALSRPDKERLRVPVATAMVGLCGAMTFSLRKASKRDPRKSADERISLVEFYDSDASAMEWLSDDDDRGSGHGDDGRQHEALLLVITQAVHCVSHLFSEISESEAATYSHVDGYVTRHGPALPLVIARVLNRFADRLLLDFGAELPRRKRNKALWRDYPFGTRTTGLMLDSTLYKAYKCLHGFTLINSSDGKESSSSSSDPMSRGHRPESGAAAAMLYRCIMRAYAQGRKAPPKSSLDTVLAALPPSAENAKTSALRKYVFSIDEEYLDLRGLRALVTKSQNWESHFSSMKDWNWDELEEGSNHGTIDDETTIVRRGISHLIAQGPVPHYHDGGADDERFASSQTETELARKLSAILEDICFGNTADIEAWCKAAQCLIVKADLIADRLGMSLGFCRNKNFFVAGRCLPEGSLSVADLLSQQEREALLRDEGWIPSIGNNLELFVRYNWSSFDSLKACAQEVGVYYDRAIKVAGRRDDLGGVFEVQVWREVESLYRKGDYVAWQQAWGGLFVSGLRMAAFRCLRLALYILYRSGESSSVALLISEISESLGVTLYSELMGSQMYGYPMHVMTPFRRRAVAEASLECFERAVAIAENPGDNDNDDEAEASEGGRVTWDLLIMVGKCHEKIAKTYQKEKFSLSGTTEGSENMRRYEYHTSKALLAYWRSLNEAKQIEKDGGMHESSGGSSHGITEVHYRLHASRLNCLIYAVANHSNERERELAELEALRLTERYWHVKPPSISTASSTEDQQQSATKRGSTRDRVWIVLSDVVAALTQCRIDHQYFHRSVYRLAQAMMWSPVLCDPEQRAVGSLGIVPATKSFKIRGLNHATNAASSAVVVISSLFERKRQQLCAVWVTAGGSSSPFQVINNSVRKYDSLRGKYINAYVDSLRLCNRRNELETFIRWISTCKRDLPSYFAWTAMCEGQHRKQDAHSTDTLVITKNRSLAQYHFLTEVKRRTNGALAAVILHDLESNAAGGGGGGGGPTDDNDSDRDWEGSMKSAYACYLRLNYDPNNTSQTKSLWKHYNARISGIRGGGIRDVIKALTTSYLKYISNMKDSNKKKKSTSRSNAAYSINDHGGWTGEGQTKKLLNDAVRKCKEVFPSLSGNYLSKKTSGNATSSSGTASQTSRNKKKKEDDGGDDNTDHNDDNDDDNDNNDTTNATTEEKTSSSSSSSSFEVTVPDGLNAGDTFVTVVKVDDTLKKVRLTVPSATSSSSARTVRFTI